MSLIYTISNCIANKSFYLSEFVIDSTWSRFAGIKCKSAIVSLFAILTDEELDDCACQDLIECIAHVELKKRF